MHVGWRDSKKLTEAVKDPLLPPIDNFIHLSQQLHLPLWLPH